MQRGCFLLQSSEAKKIAVPQGFFGITEDTETIFMTTDMTICFVVCIWNGNFRLLFHCHPYQIQHVGEWWSMLHLEEGLTLRGQLFYDCTYNSAAIAEMVAKQFKCQVQIIPIDQKDDFKSFVFASNNFPEVLESEITGWFRTNPKYMFLFGLIDVAQLLRGQFRSNACFDEFTKIPCVPENENDYIRKMLHNVTKE
jgi:hypothetical protein